MEPASFDSQSPPRPPRHAPTTYYVPPKYPDDDYSPTREKGFSSQQFYGQQEEGLQPMEKQKKQPLTERNQCIRCLCCACCLPVWARWIMWFIIIAIIIIIIVFVVLLATFTMPTMDFAGVTSSPTNQSEVSYNGDVLNFNFGLLINIKNPNVLSIDLSNINATAYYPDSSSPSGKLKIGGGYMDYQHIESHSDSNFTFPFAINYDPFSDSHKTILNILIDKCGLAGGETQDLTVDYTINLTAKLLFVKVNPTINSSASFKCPLTKVKHTSSQKTVVCFLK
ncbi:hypothetical protein INT45_005617, partial [Circinella minor]